MSRTNVSGGNEAEAASGVSRAVRIGDRVTVGATGPVGPDGTIRGETAAEQSVHCYEAIGAAIEAAGGALGDVLHTRIYVTSREDWEEVRKIQAQLFADVKPACTCCIVSGLPAEGWHVQIEAEAHVYRDAGT